jgi:hypothetical protein
MNTIQLAELQGFMEVEGYGVSTIRHYLHCLRHVPDFPQGGSKGALYEHIKRMDEKLASSFSAGSYRSFRAAWNLWFRMKAGVHIRRYEQTLQPARRFDTFLESFRDYSLSFSQVCMINSQG